MDTADAADSNSLTVAPTGREPALVAQPAEYPGYYGTTKSEISLGLIWRVAVEWRWLILSAFAIGIATAVIVTLLTPVKYRSIATIELNPQTVQVLKSGSGGNDDAGMMADPAFVATQLGVLSSRALAERVVQDLNLAGDPAVAPPGTNRTTASNIAIGMVEGGLAVQLKPQSRLVQLSFISGNPQLASRVVNGVADAYISSSMERRYQASSYARDFLERQIAKTRRDLENSERQVVAYAQEQHIINVSNGNGQGGDTSSLTGETLVSLNQALASAQARRYAVEQRYREAGGSGPTTESSDRSAPLRLQLATAQAAYEQKLKLFRPDYPEMQQLKAQIDALKTAITTETRSAQTDRAGSLRAEYLAALAEENKLQKRVGELSSSVLNLRGRSIRYTILQRDVDTNRSLYDALLQRYKEIGVAGGIGTANASVVDRGLVPGSAYSPSLSLNILIGAVLGLLLGLAIALALEFINDTIKSPDDVRRKLKLPFLGGIPSSKLDVPVDELRDPLSPVSEAYLSTTTALQLIMEGGAPKTLVVTSTRPAEGKSTTALALATSFARLGRQVLLIDADMRRPAFVTDQKADTGLSHLLTNGTNMRQHIISTDVPSLFIMPSGAIPPSPPELLASPGFIALLAEAAANFDQVVIDGPPILGLADAPLLSSVAHGTLMVVESGRTRTRAAVEALARLRTAGAHVVGAILTRYQPQASYGYGYGYGYGNNSAYRYVSDDSSRRRRILLSKPDEA